MDLVSNVYNYAANTTVGNILSSGITQIKDSRSGPLAQKAFESGRYAVSQMLPYVRVFAAVAIITCGISTLVALAILVCKGKKKAVPSKTVREIVQQKGVHYEKRPGNIKGTIIFEKNVKPNDDSTVSPKTNLGDLFEVLAGFPSNKGYKIIIKKLNKDD